MGAGKNFFSKNTLGITIGLVFFILIGLAYIKGASATVPVVPLFNKDGSNLLLSMPKGTSETFSEVDCGKVGSGYTGEQSSLISEMCSVTLDVNSPQETLKPGQKFTLSGYFEPAYTQYPIRYTPIHHVFAFPEWIPKYKSWFDEFIKDKDTGFGLGSPGIPVETSMANSTLTTLISPWIHYSNPYKYVKAPSTGKNTPAEIKSIAEDASFSIGMDAPDQPGQYRINLVLYRQDSYDPAVSKVKGNPIVLAYGHVYINVAGNTPVVVHKKPKVQLYVGTVGNCRTATEVSILPGEKATLCWKVEEE